MPMYRVERYFQPRPKYAASDSLPSPHEIETILETNEPDDARQILKDVTVFPLQKTAWKILVVDHASGWAKRVEDEETGGIWVYRVLCKDEKGDWIQYHGKRSSSVV